MFSWEILEVTPPKWPVPQEAADLTEEQCRSLRSKEQETFMFANDGYDREDFTLRRALSERKALSEIVDPEEALNGIEHALSFATPPNDATCNRRRATDTTGCSHDAAGNIGRRWSLAVDGSRREHVRAAKELVRLQREGKIAHVAENRPLLHLGALYNA